MAFCLPCDNIHILRDIVTATFLFFATVLLRILFLDVTLSQKDLWTRLRCLAVSGSDYATSCSSRTESSSVVDFIWIDAFVCRAGLRCDSTSAAVMGSEPGDVSPRTFSHNCVAKIDWFRTAHFDQQKRYNWWKNFGKYKIWETTYKLWRRHALQNCRRGVYVVATVSINTGDAPSPWRRLQEIKYWSPWRENLIPLQNLF
jgi:hypothetical protein